jgi:hypothetical protein
LKKLLLGALLLKSVCIAFANEKGSGGYIDDLIRAEMNERVTLDVQDIEKVVLKVGEELKNSTLIPLFERFLADKDLKEDLKFFQEKLEKVKSDLFLDIKISQIKAGSCPKLATTCTGNLMFTDIIIDQEAIDRSTYGVSISDLVGLIAHEYLHHIYKEIPNHDEYLLAKKMKDYILNTGYKTFELTTKDTVLTINGERMIYFSGGREGRKKSADEFCQFKGAKSAIDWKWIVLDKQNAINLGVLNNKGYYRNFFLRMLLSGEWLYTHSADFGRQSVFTSINCAKY